MTEKELIKIINRQINTAFAEDASMQALQDMLIEFVNNLIQNDFKKLVAILYKVDVDENKLKKILKENKEADAANIICRLIIEREIQKIETRRQFGS